MSVWKSKTAKFVFSLLIDQKWIGKLFEVTNIQQSTIKNFSSDTNIALSTNRSVARTPTGCVGAMSSTKHFRSLGNRCLSWCHWDRLSITWRSLTHSQMSPLLRSTTTPRISSFRSSTTFLSAPTPASTGSQPISGRPESKGLLRRRKRRRRSTGERWRKAEGQPSERWVLRARTSSPSGLETFPQGKRWPSRSHSFKNSPSPATLFINCS